MSTLSVCIPTHHGRCALLEEALESIASQVTPELAPEVEIVVSDNASHDGTESMIDRFHDRHPQIAVVYGRNDRDIRLENISRAVERASGDWCWLFGSDDLMADNGLRSVFHALNRHPHATGVAFEKINFTHDMAICLGQDAPAFFPSASGPAVYRGFAEIVRELAFQHAYLSTNVVLRERWLAAAGRVGADVARRHPDWPQLVILAEMVRCNPTWVWLPDVLVKARAGRPYLVEHEPEDGEANLAAMHAVLVDGLRDVWPEVAGRGTRLHRDLLRKSYLVAASEDVVRNIKLQDGQTLARDLVLLRSFTRAFWRLPDFRRRCLPLLLVPAFAGRVQRRRAAAGSQMQELAPAEIQTSVQATLPDRLWPRQTVRISCVVTNRGDRELRRAAPYPVALGFRWHAPGVAASVLDSSRAQLSGPLAPGESVTLEARVNTPWEPGHYELRISPVQEFVVWFDDLDPANGARFQVAVSQPEH